jgi:hypothetical protein
MARRALASTLALLCAAAAASGEDPGEQAPETAARLASEATRERHAEWFALPVLFWLPETRLGFGATGGLHFKPEGATRPSSLFAVAVYTLEQQGSLDLAGEFYPRKGGLLAARIRAVYFPDSFWGFGPTSEADARESYTRRFAELQLSAEGSLTQYRLRGGVKLDLRGEDVGDLEPGGLLASGGVLGTGRWAAIGIGGTVTYDTRDRVQWPSRGSFAQLWYLGYPAMSGRATAFGRAGAEVRRFAPLPHGLILGGAAFLELAHGETPFTLVPRLGSTRFLRGYHEGRFRDNAAWAAQAELRVPVKGRLAATTFAAVGDVASSISRFWQAPPKLAGGVGLRWRLTGQGANVRVDLAAGDEGVELYVLVLEAF